MRQRAILAGILFLFFCASSSAQNTVASCVTNEVHESYRSYHVDGRVMADGSISVSIAQLDGKVVFESHFPVLREDGNYLEWRYRDGTEYSMSRRVDETTTRTVKGMTTSAKDIVRAIKRGRVTSDHLAKNEDNYGCDFPFDDLSCTSAGNCCDTHDVCFTTFNCDALSWLGLESAFCTACNVAFVACIVNGTGGNGLPSGCCYAGNCGQTRPGDYFGSFGGAKDGDGGVMNLQQVESGGSGGGGTFGNTPWGTVYYGGGTCTFPNGVVIPCN